MNSFLLKDSLTLVRSTSSCNQKKSKEIREAKWVYTTTKEFQK